MYIGRQSRPASFANRFQVACRKYIYFNKRMSKKGPAYMNCNERQSSCTRRKAEPRKGCPTCEFTIQHTMFRKELDAELKALKRGTRKGARRWPSQLLLDTLVEVASLSHTTKKMNPKWTVATSTLVSIYRNEVAMAQAIDAFNSMPPDPETTVVTIGD